MSESRRPFALREQVIPNRLPGPASASVPPPISLSTVQKQRAVWDLFDYEYLVTHTSRRIAQCANEIPWRAIAATTGLHELGATNHFKTPSEIYLYTQFLALALADHWGLPQPD